MPREPTVSTGTIMAVGTAPVQLLPLNPQRVKACFSSPTAPLYLSYGGTAVASQSAPFVKEGTTIEERDWKGPVTGAAAAAGFIFVTELT